MKECLTSTVADVLASYSGMFARSVHWYSEIFFLYNQSAVLQVDFSYLAVCLTAGSPTIRSNRNWWELLIFV